MNHCGFFIVSSVTSWLVKQALLTDVVVQCQRRPLCSCYPSRTARQRRNGELRSEGATLKAATAYLGDVPGLSDAPSCTGLGLTFGVVL